MLFPAAIIIAPCVAFRGDFTVAERHGNGCSRLPGRGARPARQYLRPPQITGCDVLAGHGDARRSPGKRW